MLNKKSTKKLLIVSVTPKKFLKAFKNERSFYFRNLTCANMQKSNK